MKFIFTNKGIPHLYQNPDPNSPIVAHPPNGAHVHYAGTTVDKNGTTWYHIDQMGGTPGWAPQNQGFDQEPQISHQRPDIAPVGAKVETVLAAGARG